MVHQHPRAHALQAGTTHYLAVNANHIAIGDPLTERADLAVDRDPPTADPALDLAARTVAGTGQHLLQFFAH